MVKLLGLLLGVALVSAAAAAPPQFPFPQHVPLAPGSLQPSHRSQSQQDDDVRALYDAWKSRYLAQAGTEADGHPRYRVRTGRNAGDDTVSEGQGFGMVIVALVAGHDPAAQAIFDGLWEFSKDHRSAIDARLMDWKVDADEVPDPSGNDSAFDGDADIALALLLAEKQWGNGGRFDYRTEFLSVVAGIAESTIGPASDLPMLGDWVDPEGSDYSQYTPRTSDFMPVNFRAFGLATGDPRWASVIDVAQDAVTHVQTSFSPVTGLLPDFLEPVSATDHTLRPASPGFLEGPHDGHYYYNAVRVPFRLGLDAVLNGDAGSRLQAQRITLWYAAMTGGDPAGVKAGRRLDGTLLNGNNYFTTVFVATLGVAAITEPTQQEWLNDLYEVVRLTDEGYYEDTITLLALLAMTRNFWTPALVSGATTTTVTSSTSSTSTSSTSVPPCGNGVLDAGEQCDDGNVTGGDCCSSSCTVALPGTPCEDGNPCTSGLCNATGSCLSYGCNVGVACGAVCGATLRCRLDAGGACRCRAP